MVDSSFAKNCSWWHSVLAACALLLSCACGVDDAAATDAREPTARELPPLDEVPLTDDGRPGLCARAGEDKVREVFCADEPPRVGSLLELQELLGLVPGGLDNLNAERYGADSFVTLLSHSTSLAARRVSPINPRMIVLGDGTMMAYERGAQRVEVIAYTRELESFNFYLFRFEQACNADAAGCSPGDLYTPRIERDWLRVTVQDDEDLVNTSQDCRQCHQRSRDYPQLLMRELESPWTHFFQPFPEPADAFVGPGVQGHDLLQDCLDAKGDEAYGGFPVANIQRIAPFVLQSTVPLDQPVLFDASGIERERFPYDERTGYPSEASVSPTWEEAYEAFKRGDQLALPYFDARPTDPDKQTALSDAYSRWRGGELSELPDLADIFPEDPAVRARIGLQTEPDATAEDILIQACGSCHNDVLDQTLSRARFNINLWALDSAEIARAVERVERAPGSRGAMPPQDARQLDAAARARLLEFLREDPLQLPPDLKLQRAARIGMTGGGERRAPLRRD
jgi:mono/diheme cytochrome c family protein